MSMTSRLGRWSTLLWVAPAVVLLVVFVYYPVIDNVRLSLFRWNAFSPREVWVGPRQLPGAGRRPDLLEFAVQQHRLRRSSRSPSRSAVGSCLRPFSRSSIRGRWKDFFRTVYFIPAVISLTITGLLFQFMYNPQIGLVNGLLDALGLDWLKHSWLGESLTAIWSIIAMSQWQSVGYVMILFVVAMQRIPRELYEASYIDGATRTQAFFRITVPLVREMTLLAMIITVSGAFLVFNEVQVMTGGGPNNASHTLGTWLYKSAFFNDKMGYAAAIAVVIFGITLVTSVIQLLLNRGKAVQY